MKFFSKECNDEELNLDRGGHAYVTQTISSNMYQLIKPQKKKILQFMWVNWPPPPFQMH